MAKNAERGRKKEEPRNGKEGKISSGVAGGRGFQKGEGESCHKLMGAIAKAKANAAQAIPELIEIADNKRYRENTDQRHVYNAKLGWYRYDSRFALPVFDESGKIERYNVFRATMLIRHAADEKMYLYDILDIKKETSNSLNS